MLAGLFYYTVQYDISLVCFVCFFMSFISWQYHKTFQHNGILRWLPIFALTFLLRNGHFLTCAKRYLYCTVYFLESNDTPVSFSHSHENSSNVCSVISLIMWLCCCAKTPGGEVFVRSFVSHYPEGFCAPYFFCSKSPGYTSVISLLPSPPSQLKDTVGID